MYVYYICERCDLIGHSVSVNTNDLQMKLQNEIEKHDLANGNVEKVKVAEPVDNHKKIEEFNTLLSRDYFGDFPELFRNPAGICACGLKEKSGAHF